VTEPVDDLDPPSLDLRLKLRYLEHSVQVAQRHGWLDHLGEVRDRARAIELASARYATRARAVRERAEASIAHLVDRILLAPSGVEGA